MNRIAFFSSLAVASLFAFNAIAGDAKPAAPAPAPAAPAAVKSAVTESKDLKWQPLDPKQPKGLQISVIHGDPFKGPTAFLLKIPAGGKSGVHAHTNDYHATVIAGAPQHGKDEKDGKPLTVGSVWSQAGKEMHHDTCTGAAECIILLMYPNGGFDFLPGPAPAPAAPAPAPAKK